MNQDDYKITPLTCQGCGSTVPLRDGETANCANCGGSVPVPAQYREWRRTKRLELEAQERLLDLHENLGQNPSFSQKALVKATDSACCSGCLLYVITGAFGAQLLGMMLQTLELGRRHLAPNLNLNEIPAGDLIFTILILAPYFLILTLAARSLYSLRKRTKTLLFLQSNLVAAPPVHEGGQATCRNCGATLDVQQGKVTATCYYCLSHNLVALDPKWVSRLRQNTEKTSLTLQQAVEIYEAQEQQGRGCIAGCGVALLLFGVVIFASLRDSHNYEPPKEYPEPTAAVFRAELDTEAGQVSFLADTGSGRFRTELEDYVMLGDVSESRQLEFLHPETRRYFLSSDEENHRIRKDLGSRAEAKYRDVRRTFEDNPARAIRSVFATPCHLASGGERGRHPLCDVKDLDDSLQEWTHHLKGERPPLVHRYRKDLGIVISGPGLPSVSHIERVSEPGEDLFRVPEDFQKLLPDKVLDDKFFDFLGSESMMAGFAWTKFMSRLSDSPAPPASPLWTYQEEKWTKQGTQAQCVFIRRAYSHAPWDAQNPPESYDQNFIPIPEWDETAQIGDFSYYRPEDRSIVFARDRNLFSISYTTDLSTDYPVLDLARGVLQRAEARGEPASR